MLTNVAYVGKIRYKDEVHDGEHDPIVDADAFERVQKLLRRNGRNGGSAVRNKYGALLRGLLRCSACDCGMSHSYTSKGNRRYRYYVCHPAQKQGWQVCPSPSIPAGEIKRFVIDQIKCIGRDPQVVRETLAETRRESEARVERLEAERARLRGRLRHNHNELMRMASAASGGDTCLADLHDGIRESERRIAVIGEELDSLAGDQLDETQVTAALGEFVALWDALSPREQARVVELLVESVTYDGSAGSVSITFRDCGIKTLFVELTRQQEDAA